MIEKHIEKAETREELKNKSLEMVRGQGPEVDSLEVITEEMNGSQEDPGQTKLTEREREIHNQAYESHQRITELQNQMKDLEKSRVESELRNEAHLYKHYDFGIQYALKNDKEATVEGLKTIDDYIERAISEGIKEREKQKEDAEKQAEREVKEEFKREVEEHILKQHQQKPITNSLNIIQQQLAGNGHITTGVGANQTKLTDSLSIIQRQFAQQR
ncbi:TPA: hypothetical protein QCQ73_005483 [Bacillus cereus]|uniref:hypothetical protein n=1 Tax=Bacillus sp. FSL R9-6406 TaxID=2978207 RepID=UPI0030FC606C|nr:hypothetical protein [Bacillus cereus]HDR7176583.1 hypothetical protein [Bacillus cereus]HDR7975530.1 hypothetical protein [Bacillus cereus]